MLLTLYLHGSGSVDLEGEVGNMFQHYFEEVLICQLSLRDLCLLRNKVGTKAVPKGYCSKLIPSNLDAEGSFVFIPKVMSISKELSMPTPVWGVTENNNKCLLCNYVKLRLTNLFYTITPRSNQIKYKHVCAQQVTLAKYIRFDYSHLGLCKFRNDFSKPNL